MLRWSGADELLDDAGQVVAYSKLIRRKYGQVPKPETAPDPAVMKALSAEGAQHYQKALASLGYRFGVGALSYFRRVVEDSTKGILDLIEEVADAEKNEETLERIRDARASREMEEKLRIAADALPSSLRPGNVNPLRSLFKQYSRGLHGLTDEECLLVASRLRYALEYVFRTWKAQVREAKKYAEEITKWSDAGSEPKAYLRLIDAPLPSGRKPSARD